MRVLVTALGDPVAEEAAAEDEPQDDETHNDRYREGSGHFVGGN